MIDDDTDTESDAARQHAETIHRRMRRDYDAVIATVERLQAHHGLFLLRQAASAAKLEAVPGRLSGSAIRYYAAEILALLSDLRQRVKDLQALAMLLPSGTVLPAAWPSQGPGLAQMLSESQRLLLKAECEIQPLISRVLAATQPV